MTTFGKGAMVLWPRTDPQGGKLKHTKERRRQADGT
jgi:hypothetical protein